MELIEEQSDIRRIVIAKMSSTQTSGYELAKKAGVSECCVYSLLSSRTTIRLNSLLKILKALDIQIKAGQE